MSVSLQKGQKADITRNNPGLTKVVVGLGWDINKYDGGADFDLDAVVFLLGDNEKVTNDNDFVFYNNLEHPSGSVIHSGDNRTGVGEGDDERVMVDLSKIPANITKIAFAVTIHEGESRGQNFGQISNDYIRIYNEKNEEELIRYDLGEDFSIETAVVVGEIYRHGSEWKFNAVGSGFRGGLEALCHNFGVNV